MRNLKWTVALSFSLAAAFLAGCGGSSMTTPPITAQSGTVFVNGTDAPVLVKNVVAFQVDVTGMTVSDGVNPPQSILNGTQTIDFARLNGLRTLVDINTIPAGTYISVQMTLANPVIRYLNIPTPPARPSITQLDATTTPPAQLTTSSVNVPLSTPLVVSSGNIIGVLFDFRLDKSILVDGTGQITGQVTPTIKIKTITPSDADAYIDEFIAGVVNPNASSNSFVIQGPHGHQFTVNVNSQTEWENNESQANLTTNSVVQISGTLDRLTGTILADTVAILSQDNFYADGLITFVDPATGAANDFDFYDRGTLPANTMFAPGQITTINLTGNENFFIYWWHTRMASFLFNSSLMVPGQHVSLGGKINGSGASETLTLKRVVLRHEGHNGSLVPGFTNAGAGTFQFNCNGLAGALFGPSVTVFTGPFTNWSGGLNSINDLGGTTAIPLRVVGIVLRDPVSGQTVFVARGVEELQ